MRCSQCPAENPAAKVCGQCGAPLGAGCASCGAANPPENRFCGQCGAPLSKPGLQASVSPEPRIAPILTPVGTLPGEMKQVSVLFCDIVNSTPLTERLGPERMRDLVHGFLEKSTAEVRRYDGTAPQFTGRWLHGAVRRASDLRGPRAARSPGRPRDPWGAWREQ